jgi:hypothetical protein
MACRFFDAATGAFGNGEVPLSQDNIWNVFIDARKTLIASLIKFLDLFHAFFMPRLAF